MVEIADTDSTDELRHDGAIGRHHEGLRDAPYAEGEKDLPVGVLEHRPGSATASYWRTAAAVSLKTTPEEIGVTEELVLGCEVGEVGLLLTAGDAPGGEEVDHDPAAGK